MSLYHQHPASPSISSKHLPQQHSLASISNSLLQQNPPIAIFACSSTHCHLAKHLRSQLQTYYSTHLPTNFTTYNMRVSTSAMALAILSFAAALPTPPYANPTVDPATSSCNCSSLPDPVIPDSTVVTPKKPLDIPTEPELGSRGTIRPSFTSQYEVSTGAVRYASSEGKIFKDGKTTDVTALLTFAFPEESRGKTCSFHFDLDSPDAVSGSGQFDVFISQAPATKNSDSWPSGNLRDHHIGRMSAKMNGEAAWIPGFPGFGQAFPCPAGERYGGELVGAGDADHIEWLANASGPYILWESK